MRKVWLLFAVVVLLTLTATACNTPKQLVLAQSVSLLCTGPGDEPYPAITLKKGDTVKVLEQKSEDVGGATAIVVTYSTIYVTNGPGGNVLCQATLPDGYFK